VGGDWEKKGGQCSPKTKKKTNHTKKFNKKKLTVIWVGCPPKARSRCEKVRRRGRRLSGGEARSLISRIRGDSVGVGKQAAVGSLGKRKEREFGRSRTGCGASSFEVDRLDVPFQKANKGRKGQLIGRKPRPKRKERETQ